MRPLREYRTELFLLFELQRLIWLALLLCLCCGFEKSAKLMKLSFLGQFSVSVEMLWRVCIWGGGWLRGRDWACLNDRKEAGCVELSDEDEAGSCLVFLMW